MQETVSSSVENTCCVCRKCWIQSLPSPAAKVLEWQVLWKRLCRGLLRAIRRAALCVCAHVTFGLIQFLTAYANVGEAASMEKACVGTTLPLLQISLQGCIAVQPVGARSLNRLVISAHHMIMVLVWPVFVNKRSVWSTSFLKALHFEREKQ